MLRGCNKALSFQKGFNLALLSFAQSSNFLTRNYVCFYLQKTPAFLKEAGGKTPFAAIVISFACL